MPLLEPRVMLAGRHEALVEKERKLLDQDPWKERTREKMQEVEAQLKDLGGRTGQKLIVIVLDRRKSSDIRRREIKEAEQELREAKQRSASVVEEEGRAIANVRSCIAQLENNKAKYAFQALLAFVEATMGGRVLQ